MTSNGIWPFFENSENPFRFSSFLTTRHVAHQNYAFFLLIFFKSSSNPFFSCTKSQPLFLQNPQKPLPTRKFQKPLPTRAHGCGQDVFVIYGCFTTKKLRYQTPAMPTDTTLQQKIHLQIILMTTWHDWTCYISNCMNSLHRRRKHWCQNFDQWYNAFSMFLIELQF